MNIVYASDDNYSFLLGTSILSLTETNKEEDICIYIISDHISEENISRIRSITHNHKHTIKIIPSISVDEMTDISIFCGHWSLTAYVRFFVGDILKEINRAIWIDCDTIICHSLQDLWQIDLQNNVAGAVLDCSKRIRYQNGFDLNDRYYNSGVLLIDLDKWRSMELSKKYMDKLMEQKGYSIDVDQGIINQVLRNNICTLPLKYNVTPSDYMYGIKVVDRSLGWDSEKCYYSRDERIKSMSDPYIIHFLDNKIANVRPWHVHCTHPLKDIWWNYFNRTPWAGDKIVSKQRISTRQKTITFLLRNCPDLFFAIRKRIKGI